MARIKGGKRKEEHNRVLKLAKGYRGARSKQYRVAKAVRNESFNKRLRRKKAEEETVQTVMDRTYQRCSKNERTFLQQVHVWLKVSRRRS